MKFWSMPVLLLVFIMMSPCFASSARLQDPSCYKNRVLYNIPPKQAMSECRDSEKVMGMLDKPVIKGLTPMRIFLDRKFDRANYYAHQLYGPAIIQQYDTGYWVSGSSDSGIFYVSRRISWWTPGSGKDRIRTSFYVIFSVNMKNQDIRILETKTLSESGY